MTATFVRHRVSDYSKWREVYDSVAGMQKAAGVTEEAVYRSVDDPNVVLVMHRFTSIDQARSFFDSEELRAAMGQAGVDASSLRLEFYDEA
jgi:quinol monooxygenase YgiN